MLVLHAVVSPGRGVCLWAEDPSRERRSASRARRGVRPHPFALDARELAARVPVPRATPGQAVLTLPSRPDGPAASDLLADRDAEEAGEQDHGGEPAGAGEPDAAVPMVLASWTVPVLEVADALPGTADDVHESASVTVLRALVEAAKGLLARGRVLPAQDDDGVLRWRPVLQGPDLVVADAFAAALPPVARAEALPHGGRAEHGELEAAAAVAEVLGVAVDAEARRRLADLPTETLEALPGWVAGLTDPDPSPEPAPERALPDAAAAGLRRWSVVGAPHAGPARATFRLREVVADELAHALEEPRFRLDFALQSSQDPSLLVEAETVWRDGAALRRWLDEPSELLLAELGRAARVYPELGEALRTPRPTGTDLDRSGAHHFLAEAAAHLDRAGFEVLLPSWWSKPSRLGLTGQATGGPEGVVVMPSRLGRDHLVDFSWRLSIDGEALTDDEMTALVEAKAPLVRLRGRWVAVDPEKLRAGLDFLDRHPGAATDVGAVLHLAAAHPDDLDAGLEIDAVTADGVLGDLLAGAAPSTLALLDTPDAVDAVLRAYQRRGLSWLAFLAGLGVGGVLADDMGLGKTLQVLALEAHERAAAGLVSDLPPQDAGSHSRGRRPPATLLVCPTSVVTTWRREAERFVPSLRVAVHHGAGRSRDGLADLAANHDLVVTSYGTLTRDVDALAGIRFRRLVLDEAQMVKNNRSRAARAVRRIDAEHRLALTGTPVENRLAELWSIMDAVNPGLLGSVSSFRERYAVPVERHGRTDVARDLRARVRPFLLRRVKTDPTVVDDLPEKIETVERCSLSTEQASLYQAAVDEMLEKVSDAEGFERRGRVLAGMTKLKQICDHPALLLGDATPTARRSGKIVRLEEVLGEILAAGEKALLFTQFAAFGHLLAPHLAARFDSEVAWLHGSTSRAARDRMVERFQNADGSADRGPSLFLLSLRAGGTGLTLTAASHVIHLDRWWNPAVEDQATDRAFRIGQHRTVTVRRMLCAGTLEERIDDLIAGKRELADLAVADGEDWLTGLSTDELARVVSLDRDASADEPDDDPGDDPGDDTEDDAEDDDGS